MSKKLTKEDYVSKAIAIHGNKYDYSKLIYKGIFNKVQIICPIHGKFSKIAHYHTNKKQGCPKCGMERSKANQALTNESFIKKAKAIHGEKYDYSQVQYSNAKTKVKIFCSIDNHGVFNQTPNEHLYQKSGCPKCGGRLISNTDEFISASLLIHSEKYDYSKSIFKNAKEKVIIICPFHGEFKQAAYHHSHGIGCPKCGHEIQTLGETIHELESMGRDFDGCLYILEISNEEEHFYKIGISRNLKRRYTGFLSIPYYWDVILEANIGIVAAYKIEQEFLNIYSEHCYIPKLRFAGETECFSINPIELDERLREFLTED